MVKSVSVIATEMIHSLQKARSIPTQNWVGIFKKIFMENTNDQIQNAFKTVSDHLFALEELIRISHNPPYQNINPSEFNLIQIPSKYVRKATYFRNEFGLNQLIKESNQIDNISYALQLNDLFDFIIHRLGVFGVIKTLVYKYAIINVHAIVEGIIFSTYETLNSYCWFDKNICSKNSKCNFYVQSTNKLNFKQLIEKFKTDFNIDFDIEAIVFLKSLRDNIHIQEIKYSEWAASSIYNHDNYLLGIKILRQLKNDLPLKISEFKIQREFGCTKRSKSTKLKN